MIIYKQLVVEFKNILLLILSKTPSSFYSSLNIYMWLLHTHSCQAVRKYGSQPWRRLNAKEQAEHILPAEHSRHKSN